MLTVADDGVIQALAVGEVEVAVTTVDGVTDRIAWEVVEPESAELFDELHEFAVAYREQYPETTDGVVPIAEPSDPLVTWNAQPLELNLEVVDDQQRSVAWSGSSVQITGGTGNGLALTIDADSANVQVEHGDRMLLDLEIERVESLETGTLDLAFLVTERPPDPETVPEVEPEDDAFESLATFKATLLDGQGRQVYQAPIEWSSRGPGEIRPFGGEESRRDLVHFGLVGADIERFETAKARVTARMETDQGELVRSAWLAPNDFAVFEDADCGGRAGCACSNAGGVLAPGWALLALPLVLRRRRRGAARPGSGPDLRAVG